MSGHNDGSQRLYCGLKIFGLVEGCCSCDVWWWVGSVSRIRRHRCVGWNSQLRSLHGLKRNYFCGLNPELLASMSMFNGYFNCHLSGMISTCAAVFHPVQGPDFHVIGMTVWLLAQSSNKTLKLYTNRDKWKYQAAFDFLCAYGLALCIDLRIFIGFRSAIDMDVNWKRQACS